jgi:hypothetical protein
MDSSLPDSNFVPGKERYFNGQLIAGFQFCTRQGALFIWTAHCRIPILYPARNAILMDSSLPDSNLVPGKERYILVYGHWTAHCRILDVWGTNSIGILNAHSQLRLAFKSAVIGS